MIKSHIPKILITAGPTREFIDALRFISNPSTGRIGYLIAENACKRGYEVILLSGPTSLLPPKNVKIVYFESALDLKEKVDKYFLWANWIIFSSAVGDFRPVRKLKNKIKKSQGAPALKLVKNPDILKELGSKKADKILVGFALETNRLIENARLKLEQKKLDLIVANQLSEHNFPFGNGKLSAALISENRVEKFEQIKKIQLASIILDRIEHLCYNLNNIEE
ncbi:MAG: hypothetical protein DRP78_04285 [Candidatus Omnitrophota bacterium]|nr:MAG: hypothetical protein DRP78_04285 [Candidatus Omnitrophota bacterium]